MTATGALLFFSLMSLSQTHASEPDAAARESVWLGRFEATHGAPIPAPWQVLRLNRITATEYRLRIWDGIGSIEALADNSMALLARPARIDLSLTPVLCWRWRIDDVVPSADLKRKSGDDYAARVYVAFSLPPQDVSILAQLSLRAARRLFGDAVPDAAINYVWDNRHPVGTVAPNAYTERVKMIVMQTGNERSRQWVWERRDVALDFASHFGASAPEIVSIAIAADTDDTHTMAHAGFADIHFVAREVDCTCGDHASR